MHVDGVKASLHFKTRRSDPLLTLTSFVLPEKSTAVPSASDAKTAAFRRYGVWEMLAAFGAWALARAASSTARMAVGAITELPARGLGAQRLAALDR